MNETNSSDRSDLDGNTNHKWGTGVRSKIRALWCLMRDPEAPRRSKLLVLAALGYALFPIDLIPDTIPILGWMDDGAVIAIVMGMVAADLKKYIDPDS